MKKIVLSFLFFVLLIHAYAQSERTRKADKLFNEFAYIESIKEYEEIARTGSLDMYVCRQLAEANRRVGNSEQCEYWYRMLIDMNSTDPTDFYYYSQALKSNRKYKDAEKWIKKFRELNSTDSRMKREVFEVKNGYVSFADSNSTSVMKLNINSKYSDFSPAFYKDKIVYVSGREEGNKSQSNYLWDKQPFLDIFVGERLQNQQLINIRPLSDDINTIYHEGPVTFNETGSIIYFTRNNLRDSKKLVKDKKQTTNLKIYSSQLIGDKWCKITEFKYNSDEFSTGHPSLTADGQRLYFASDRPGGYGQADIYFCVNDGGGWSEPVNLGPAINTEGNEMFPYIHKDGTLYFASDGLVGLGGLDNFAANSTSDTSWTISNLNYPVNGPKDDFGLILDTNRVYGYFSSNRKGGEGYDDIYLFKMNSDDLLSDMDDGNDTTNFDNDGNIKDKDKKKRNGFGKGKDDPKDGNNGNDDDYIDYYGKKIKIGEPVVLENIYYDYDKWNIRPDAAVELNKLIRIMIKYPNMVIELSSHTDCRGTFQYNMDLSQKRANSAIEYMYTMGGIEQNRSIPRGYGETKLVNKCADDVKCSEDEHQQNRRTEFTILKK